MHEEEIGAMIVDAAVKLHRELGPGLLESAYEVVLAHRLRERGLRVERQVGIAICVDGLTVADAFRADMVVEDKVIVEIKSVEVVLPVHKKQLLTYLRLSNRKLGFLLNFGAERMKDGITRIINGEL